MAITITAQIAEIEMYIWERQAWPAPTWREALVSVRLAAVRHDQRRLLGRIERLGSRLRVEAALQTLTQDVWKSSEIEGEVLDAAQVRSSIARPLGIDVGGLIPTDRIVEGLVEVMLDATRQLDQPLAEDRLQG